jgi:hypothetical protein
MKKFLLPLFCFAFITKTYSQSTTKNNYGRVVVEIIKKKRRLPPAIEVKVDCPVADSSWVRWVDKNIKLSITEGKRMKKGKYTVAARFIISRDGSLSDISCENDPGFELCNEVIRVIKKSKNWTPATQSYEVRPLRGTQQR